MALKGPCIPETQAPLTSHLTYMRTMNIRADQQLNGFRGEASGNVTKKKTKSKTSNGCTDYAEQV